MGKRVAALPAKEEQTKMYKVLNNGRQKIYAVIRSPRVVAVKCNKRLPPNYDPRNYEHSVTFVQMQSDRQIHSFEQLSMLGSSNKLKPWNNEGQNLVSIQSMLYVRSQTEAQQLSKMLVVEGHHRPRMMLLGWERMS